MLVGVHGPGVDIGIGIELDHGDREAAIAQQAPEGSVILAMLPSMARQVSESTDTQTALRLADAVQSQLRGETVAGKLDALVSHIPVMDKNADSGRLYVAEHDGSNLRLLNANESPLHEQYFLIDVRRYSQASLAYDPAQDFLTVNIVVTWPYRLFMSTTLTVATAAQDRQQETFNVVIPK